MLTTYPLQIAPVATGSSGSPRVAAVPPPASHDSWRYHGASRSRMPLIVAVLTSVAFHAGLALGLGRSHTAPAPKVSDTTMIVSLVMPEIKELEEPDHVADDRPEIRFDTLLMPRQIDMPTITMATDFVQAVDFSTIIDKSSLKAGEIVIPDSARQLADKGVTIFNIADLDRKPEVIFQTELRYPPELKRAGIGGTLLVEFIVDENGTVHDPEVVSSTDVAFEAPARNGILRWRFRPGMKNGAKVSTRMRVPIEFKVVD